MALGFLIGLVEFEFWADDGIELLPDLAGNGAGPSGADLPKVDQVLAFLLSNSRLE